MPLTILAVALLALAAGFILGRAYEASKSKPATDAVDPWLANFREYRAGYREYSLATVYERWSHAFGYHPAVADYVSRMGVFVRKVG